jgi:hypothetical protein
VILDDRSVVAIPEASVALPPRDHDGVARALDSIATVHRLVAFYVDAHNRVLRHSAFRGQTPDEMYFGTGDALPTDLASRAAAARRARLQANRSASCVTCRAIATGV